MNLNKKIKSIVIHFGKWIPDKTYLKILYFLDRRKFLNLKNPKTFTEKIQWLKIHDRNPEYCILVDKIKVKELVASKIGERYVIPTLSIYDTVDSIDLKKLPDKFVLKTNHDSGGVILCQNKEEFDINNAKKKLKKSFKRNYYKTFREWPYKNINRKIFAETHINDTGNKDITDYKWFCFNGKPLFCQVIKDRNTKETIDFYDSEWNHMDFVGLNINCRNSENTEKKPTNLNEQLQIAKSLSAGFKFIRVDLYNIKGKIYFGELTLYPASGFGTFSPDEWNYKLGDLIDIH